MFLRVELPLAVNCGSILHPRGVAMLRPSHDHGGKMDANGQMDTTELLHYIREISGGLMILTTQDTPTDEGERKEWIDKMERFSRTIHMLSLNRAWAQQKFRKQFDDVFEEARTLIYLTSKVKKNGLNLRPQD
jgi:hypothetical protein